MSGTMAEAAPERARRQLSALARVTALFERDGIEYWLFGGWAVDFYARRVTREHDDLDLAVWLADLPRISKLLEGDGWVHAPEPDEDGGTGYENGGVRLELTYLVRDDRGSVFTPLRGGRAAWSGDALAADAAVGLCDRGDDREAESNAAARARPRGIGAVEAFENPLENVGAHAGAFVRDPDHCVRVLVCYRNLYRRVRGRMRTCVAQEVVDDLPEALAIAEHHHRLGFEPDPPRWINRLRGLDSFRHDLVHSHRLPLQRTSLVEAREQQQILDERAHALRLACDPVHRAREIFGPSLRPALEELCVRPHGGKRRAQLVRRVGDEATQLLLGLPCPLLRCLTRLECRLDLSQHRVERDAEAPDFRPLVRVLDPPREIPGCDPGRRSFDRPERAEA